MVLIFIILHLKIGHGIYMVTFFMNPSD